MRGLWSRAGATSLAKSGTSKAADTILGRSGNTLPFEVDDDFAVLLGERTDVGVLEDVEHGFGGPAQQCAHRRHDERPVEQDGVSLDGIEQLVVTLARIAQVHSLIRGVL